ncbi:MAG: FAD/NAD(P)-binding protein [Caldimicrobium sp.]|nr:FAD/NAD(P)-binding protein [Caldimicrobium sp.]MDW8093861.1 FAD/NAD(P)-binding protein [Caldimicrobium sp.]
MLENPYVLKKGKIYRVIQEYEGVYTFFIEGQEKIKPGQYHMLYALGRGEAPITVAGKTKRGFIHTIRAVGSVTKSLVKLEAGDEIYYRGPFGNTWNLKIAYGKPLLFISGGLGLAANKFPFEVALQNRSKFSSLIHLYGARDTQSLLYRYLYSKWAQNSDFQVIVERGETENLKKGLVTDLLEELTLHSDTVVFICGPEAMWKPTLRILIEKGISEERIFLSLERHMKCSIGTCGHCMIGPFFVCKDGPIFRYDQIKVFLEGGEF